MQAVYKCDGIHEWLPKNLLPLEMGKILVLVLFATAAGVIASRDVPSQGGRGWQGSSFGGGPSSGFARSSRGGLGQSASAGWGGRSSFGSSARSRSGIGNRSPSNSGWSQSGYSSNGGYGGNSFRSSPGNWNNRFSDSTVIESLDSSNGWDKPGLGFRSNNGWQSSAW